MVVEGGDRLDLARIIITDVGRGWGVEDGLGRYTHHGVVMTTPTNISIKPTSISFLYFPSTTFLALPIVLPPLYVGGRDIKQPAVTMETPRLPGRVVIICSYIRRRGYNIDTFVCMFD